MSQEAYHAYYQEYQRLVSEYAQSPSDELYQELQLILQQMSTEARCMAEKEEYLERTLQYKQNVAAMATKQQRSFLLSSSNADAHLKSNEDQLTKQNETLERARSTMMETEEISLGIQEELARNRTTLQSSHNKTKDLSDMTQQAGAILKSMTPWWRR
ncbi:hypothetical protein FisN_36Hu042 [Fistulifera solaris]|uniref:Vesicle transport through interaction with t-SNAREs 1 n=1 Tax=Fistulifera solaris TaxID=1519565 RepID=A0A1Z5KTM3_FISSO|nr:hypothetical protein FisN_36Hu042 [Fistulifera solaris]|eukprot:GAX29547.1 hypothetical protein FisN_36Hu042 [Fistulifera solaris]